MVTSDREERFMKDVLDSKYENSKNLKERKILNYDS